VLLTLQHIGDITAQIIRQTQDGLAVEFAYTEEQRDALIRKIYCGRYPQGQVEVRGRRLLHALVARTLR